jgi:hypothetical protein
MQATKYTPVGNHGADPAPQHETDDAIDDRIAEILDELLDERNAKLPYRRLPYNRRHLPRGHLDRPDAKAMTGDRSRLRVCPLSALLGRNRTAAGDVERLTGDGGRSGSG